MRALRLPAGCLVLAAALTGCGSAGGARLSATDPASTSATEVASPVVSTPSVPLTSVATSGRPSVSTSVSAPVPTAWCVISQYEVTVSTDKSSYTSHPRERVTIRTVVRNIGVNACVTVVNECSDGISVRQTHGSAGYIEPGPGGAMCPLGPKQVLSPGGSVEITHVWDQQTCSGAGDPGCSSGPPAPPDTYSVTGFWSGDRDELPSHGIAAKASSPITFRIT